MKLRLLSLLALLLCCIFAGAIPASATITFPQIVQSPTDMNPGDSLTISATGANNAIATCAVYYGGAYTSASVPTDGGDTFTLAGTNTANRPTNCWWSVGVAAGRTTITYPCTCVNFSATVWEIHSSFGTNFTTNGSANAAAATGTSSVGASLTTTGANDVIIAAQGNGSGGNVTGTASNGGVIFTCDKCSLVGLAGFASLLNRAAGTYQPAYTYDASVASSHVTMAFAEGTAASPGSRIAGPSKLAGPTKVD